MYLKHWGAVTLVKWTLTLKAFLFSISLWNSAWISFVNYMVWQECDLFYNEMSIMQEVVKGLFKCVKCHTWTPSEWQRINTFNSNSHSLAVSLPTVSLIQWPHQRAPCWVHTVPAWQVYSPLNQLQEWASLDLLLHFSQESYLPSAVHSAEGTVQ